MVDIVLTVRNRLGRAWLVIALTATLTIPALTAPAEAAAGRRIDYRQWETAAQLAAGSFAGVRVERGMLRLSGPVGTRTYADPHGGPTKTYAYGRWTSPWATSDFAMTELIASWDATTPRDSWIEVQVRGRSEDGQRSSWDTLARWSEGDASFHRTSPRRQANGMAEVDDLAGVATDTWKSHDGVAFTSWQLRVTLLRRAGTSATPWVDTVGAVTSRLPNVSTVPTSTTGITERIVLDVPRYSQMIHDGDYPKYDGGGEAWCSPTSTSMVLGYYDRLPSADEIAWVESPHPNRFVDHAARMTYDYGYDGAGNWPFNTAYAANHADHAFVTRLRSLRQAEAFIKAGIPVVASVAFGKGEMAGVPPVLANGTKGHLLVIVGFTASGDVVVNDPAAPRNRGVRRTYDRGEFENAWLPGSGGLAYIIRTSDRQLPVQPRATNW